VLYVAHQNDSIRGQNVSISLIFNYHSNDVGLSARITTFAQLNELTTPSYIYAVFVVIADLLIAGMLTFLLQRARGRPSARSQDPMKTRIDTTVQQLVRTLPQA
jgi:hypothetical protein